MLNDMDLNELSLMDNYDMVIHLVTAADGKEEYYTLGNNSARIETVEEVKRLDKALYVIHNLLGEPISIKEQRKFSINLKEPNLLSTDKEVVKIGTNILLLKTNSI